MPRFPSQSDSAAAIRASVFARLAEGLKKPGIVPLHIGDTHLPPPEPARWERRPLAGEAIYKYGEPRGLPALRDEIAKDFSRRGIPDVVGDDIVLHAGATHALACAARTLLAPGDEVLVPSPYWPLIVGVVRTAGAIPVEVPLTHLLYEDPSRDPAELLEPHVTARTAAIYVASPNNPDGKVHGPAALASIAELARRHSLWILADDVYRDYLWVDGTHVSIASLPGMRERTAVAVSFSKSHALAGDRVGALVPPREVLPTVQKVANHTLFNVPVASQLGALAALRAGDPWIGAARERYRGARDMTLARLGHLAPAPEGAAYLFARVGDDAYPLLANALDAGVALAPGDGFGAAFTGWFRLCFTAVPEPELERALDALAPLLRNW
jgi:aspartate/methionine/tyrosine aminotransferase